MPTQSSRYSWSRIAASLILAALVDISAALSAFAEEALVDRFGRSLADTRGPIWYPAAGDGGGADSEDLEAGAGATVAGYTLSAYTATSIGGSSPDAVAIGDVTGDGRNDVVLTTTHYGTSPNNHHAFLFVQLANGTLAAPVKYPYLNTANRNGIVIDDLDDDGFGDLVVGHANGITVFRADGIGGLSPGTVFLDSDANTLATTDVNRDGHLDIISLGWSRGATIFYGDGTGAFPTKQALATNASGYNDHEVGDLNNDGVPDLAVMSGQLYATPNLSVHLHNGISAFVAPPNTYFMGTSQTTDGVGLGDVTGDGLHDVVLSRPRNSPTNIWVMQQTANGQLVGPTSIPSYDIPESVEVADMDGDGREDVAVVHGGWNRLGVYLQRSTGGLTAETRYVIPYASHYQPQGLALGDFSGDGCVDVAIADYNSGLVTLRGQNCLPSPTPTASITSTITPTETEAPTETPTQTSSATPVDTSTPVSAPTITPIPIPTETEPPTSTPTPLPTESATPIATSTPTQLPTESATPVATSTPISTSTNTQTATPTMTPTPVATTTSSVAVCAAAPMSGCAVAPASRLSIRSSPDQNRNWLRWRWSNGSASKNEFGNPVGSTSYAACVYRDAALVMTATVSAGELWSEQRSGFAYRSKAPNASGISRVLLKAGEGRARVTLNGGRGNLDVSSLPLNAEAGVTIQLVKNPGSGTQCWSATFAVPHLKDDDVRFMDILP